MIFIVFRQDFILRWSISLAKVCDVTSELYGSLLHFQLKKTKGNVCLSFLNRITDIQANTPKHPSMDLVLKRNATTTKT